MDFSLVAFFNDKPSQEELFRKHQVQEYLSTLRQPKNKKDDVSQAIDRKAAQDDLNYSYPPLDYHV